MKKVILISTLLVLSLFSLAQKGHHKKNGVKVKHATNKYNDNIDNRMKGPKGEIIYIGQNGGRYYIKNGKKIYVEFKGNKK